MKDSILNPRATVGVMIWRDKNVLLGKRKGSHGSGEYSFTGGHIEFGESFEDAARRETWEEAGINIKDIKFLGIANDFKNKNRHDILVMFTANWESGEPIIMEPEKCESWDWYSLDNLPTPIFYPAKLVLNSYQTKNNFYDQTENLKD